MTLSTGEMLNNRYRVVRLLGQGGFGAVYRGWDTLLERPCAIKENLDVSPEAQRQFLREAKLLANLVHANLPRVSDTFIVPGQGQYLVMDYVEGEDLQEKLTQAGGPLPEAQVLPWILQVCEALEYLHQQTPPVIHRDIKPANIRITPQGRAMLVDFGIAKLYDPNLRTMSGARAVTPGYSPPEQYGQGSTDARSDIYALGATLYALLTGRAMPDSVDIMSGDAPVPPPAIRLNPALRKEVSAAIEKATQISRAQRYAGVAEFRQALTPVARPAAVSSPTPRLPQAAPPQYQTPLQPTEVVPSGPAVAGRSRTPRRFRPRISRKVLVRALVGIAVLGLICLLFIWYSALGGKILLTTLTADYRDEKGVPMALIPAGEFQMGSENGGDSEKPVHTVYLDAFYMDMYEVTNVQYEKCVQAGVCTAPDSYSSYERRSYYGDSDFADYPVIYVDWEQARTFCEDWRGARLPTEAEWEKAARGGLKGGEYPWGNVIPDCSRANYYGCVNDTRRVGSYPANGYGLYDMAGNVWEWVWDWYDDNYYSSSPDSNPQGPDSGSYRVLRGGGWYLGPNYLRVAIRGTGSPDGQAIYIGFRCGVSVLPGR
ncbi:MAG: SUMF1/EgtB/PvdO family nonheme iron enzyme [Anaerolineales bacterium]|nr:SUMF1/EgtB/PvdO family nonheme iron enzyme [Anaerolineales bacterium]